MNRASLMSEEELQNAVIQVARIRGWLVVHPRPGQTVSGRWATQTQGDAGSPDLWLVKPPMLIAAELKAEKGRLSPAQHRWIWALQRCPGVMAFIWRPQHWLSGEIERVLTQEVKP